MRYPCASTGVARLCAGVALTLLCFDALCPSTMVAQTPRPDLQKRTGPPLSPLLPASTVLANEDRYVSGTGSDMTGDGLSSATAYQTIGRALADIPAVPGGKWRVFIASGRYSETVRIERFAMPSDLSQEQLYLEPDSPTISISLIGDSRAGVTIAAVNATSPCISISNAVVFLQELTCTASGHNGIMANGSSVVIDDAHVTTSTASRAGIILNRSTLYIGGTLEIAGPFADGLSIRTYSLARPGTRLHSTLSATFKDLDRGLFLRDHGTFTTFGGGEFVFENVKAVVYALFSSIVFFTNNVSVHAYNVHDGFQAFHMSEINLNMVVLDGLKESVLRCGRGGGVTIERGTYSNAVPGAIRAVTDSTCFTTF
jgi:hypothetical protein